MLKSYLKIAWRNLARSKVHSFINIAGLSVGMAVAMLIGLWIWDEVSFDRSVQHHDRIAQVMQNQIFNGDKETWAAEAWPLGEELRVNYGSNFKHVVMSTWNYNHTMTYENKIVTRSGSYMEQDAPDMLSLKMLKGSNTALKDPGNLLISASSAKALFGEADPIDKLLKIDNRQQVKVAGVYEDLPENSSFADLHFIAPWELMVKSDDLAKRLSNPWGASWFQAFVELADHVEMEKASANIKEAKWNRVKNSGDARFKPVLFLHPMNRWHLYGEFRHGVNTGGRIQNVWMFGIIGIFVLLLACINFMNLSTARSEKRAKEVGIRKSIGSMRNQLVTQFFSESVFLSFLAFVFCLILVQLALPFFNEVSEKKMSILWNNPSFWFAGLGFCLFTGIISGTYPAFYLSSFNPVSVLKGTFRVGRFASVPRKVLVVVQFSVSVTLIIGTIVVFSQIQFAKNRPVGYSRNGLVTVPIKSGEINKHYAAFRSDLLATGAVQDAAFSENPITQTYTTNSGFTWKGKDPGMQEEFVTMRVTHEFGKTIGWKIKEGRDFSKDFATDTSAFVINEAAAAYLKIKNPVGETIMWENEPFKIIGVVTDMVTRNPYEPAKQMLFFLNYSRTYYADLRITATVSTPDALAKIEAVFKKYDPADPFEYTFVDSEYAQKFSDEVRVGKLAGFFAALAIFISCLGLFGLASFVAEQRTKEIGVRKVLGATVFSLCNLLSREFIALVFISLLVAVPLSDYFMGHWLQNYEYRTELSVWMFAVACIGALMITILTVSFQAIRAALANPVRSLRSE